MVTLQDALSLTKERFDGSILSEETHSLSKSELSAIRKYTRRDINAEEVYTFPALAIDTNPTRNGVIYSAESQKATVRNWIGTPFLFNASGNSGLFHDADHSLQAASQFGRIYKAQLVETGKSNVGTLVWVFTFPDVSPSLREFVNKVDSGILREISIHVIAEQVECSICGEQFGAEGHEHTPGGVYGKKTCYIQTVGQLTPIELSSVACPGSTVAHIMDDGEVSQYKLLPLREALRGSHSSIEASMGLDQRKKLLEASDPPADDKKDDQEAKDSGKEPKPGKKTSQVHKSDDDECDEADDSGKESKPRKGTTEDEDMEAKDPDGDDQPDDDEPPKNSRKAKKQKQSFKLFADDEECPTCLRKESSSKLTDELREQAIGEYRAEVEPRFLRLSDKLKEAKQAYNDAIQMREDFADETVSLAIEKGFKEARQRDEYYNELISLGYPAMKLLRETYKNAPSKREELRQGLQDRAESDYRSVTSRRPAKTPGSTGFSSPIGPSSKRDSAKK